MRQVKSESYGKIILYKSRGGRPLFIPNHTSQAVSTSHFLDPKSSESIFDPIYIQERSNYLLEIPTHLYTIGSNPVTFFSSSLPLSDYPPSYIQQDESNPSSNRNQTCRAAHTDLSSRPKAAQTDAMFARKSAISSSIDALDAHSAYANSAKTSVDSKSRQDDSHKWVSVPDPRSTDRSLSGKEGGGGKGFHLEWEAGYQCVVLL